MCILRPVIPQHVTLTDEFIIASAAERILMLHPVRKT